MKALKRPAACDALFFILCAAALWAAYTFIRFHLFFLHGMLDFCRYLVLFGAAVLIGGAVARSKAVMAASVIGFAAVYGVNALCAFWAPSSRLGLFFSTRFLWRFFFLLAAIVPIVQFIRQKRRGAGS